MTAPPKIHRPTATTLLALAALAVIELGCAKTAVRKDAAPVADTVQAAAAATLDTVSGTFTDSRDAKTYRTVRIGELTWMAENLNFATDSSRCYDDADSNCTKYGRLYNWNDAMTACPAGWRVPSDEDWDGLAMAAGGQRVKDECGQLVEYEDGNYYWKFAGKKLKSTTGWRDYWEDDDGKLVSGNGTGEFGFSALPGGIGYSGGNFYSVGDYGSWWSATERGASNAWDRFMYYDGGSVIRDYSNKARLYSVRCVRDFAAPQ
ncbi:MAG: fibrobacter succinogenes major paralogous domain-containing protein [Chitinispirillia bacterium]|nr:fibrobacter succinogenes major paralogous domain-containing protein [Chitinispirillia bacterium]MCL2241507.1 fibrobacter succinogenes major paralogous domain-containing protein [Chitinispirillia bacterium]